MLDIQVLRPFQTPSRITVARQVSRKESEEEAIIETGVYNTYCEQLHKSARSPDGSGLRGIISLIREFDTNPLVIESASHTIALLCEKDEATREFFGSYGCIEVLLQTLRKCDTSQGKTMKALAYAISSLIFESSRNIRKLESLNGILPLAKLASLKKYDDTPGIAIYSLSAVAGVKYRCDKGEPRISYKSRPGLGKVVSYINRTLRIHEGNEQVQEVGIDAIRALITVSPNSALSLSSYSLEKCIYASSLAYETLSSKKDVIWQSLALQCDINSIRPGADEGIVLELNSFFGALRSIARDGKNERNAIWIEAITNLIYRGLNLAVKIGTKGTEWKTRSIEAKAIDCCMEILEIFPHNGNIVEKCGAVMRSLKDGDREWVGLDTVSTARNLLRGIEIISEDKPPYLLT